MQQPPRYSYTHFLAGVAILLISGVTAYSGIQINRQILRSRIVTQAQIEEGWKTAGIELSEHTVKRKENFWSIAKQYGVTIDSIVGANPGLTRLHAALSQKIRVPNRRGVIHRTEEQDDLLTLAALYHVPPEIIAGTNNLGPKHILVPGVELFIPDVKPIKLSGEMSAHYSLRGIFGSPLPGRITSGMGLRTHPVGGFRGKHTGVDLASQEGTRIAAAAGGVVVQTGEGEYIGKFVILSHQDTYTTLYGHCSQILVTQGRPVKKGQIIARVGSTGRTTGAHLHFEIRKDGMPQNPLQYLW